MTGLSRLLLSPLLLAWRHKEWFVWAVLTFGIAALMHLLFHSFPAWAAGLVGVMAVVGLVNLKRFWKRPFSGRGNTDLDRKLISAIESRSVDEVRALLSAGANANARAQRWKRTPSVAPAMHFALVSEHTGDDEEEKCLRIIDLLVKSGADVDATGPDGYGSKEGPFTALMNAVQNNRVKTVERLIERGANTSIRALDGSTAFQICKDAKRDSGTSHWDVQRVLAKTTKDGKVWAQTQEGKAWLRDREDDPKAPLGVSPAGAWSELQDALTKSSPKQDKIISWVKSGGNVNWTCAEGMSLLHYAAMQDNERMARFLLDHRANVNAEAKFKMTPLLWACKSISTSVIPLLLDHGANPNAKANDGHTALQFIRHSGLDAAENAAKLLISRGAVTTPGKDSACPECGSPYSAEMAKRGVRITMNREYAEFACLGCKKQAQADLEHIDKSKGVRVLCSCGATTYIPPSVWCKTCGGGLSTGWQKQISTGAAADEAAKEFTDPGVKRSRQIAKELKAAHGRLKAIHFKSHHPNFGIDFDFSDGKRISSGATAGDIAGG